MKIAIAETFVSRQGEGFHQGVPTFFVRFAGCGVITCGLHPKWWSDGGGCDTDFRVVARDTPRQIVDFFMGRGVDWICITGGEPCDQPVGLASLVAEIRRRAPDAKINLQTSGTLPVPVEVDWLAVSPKNLDGTVIRECDELKYVYRGMGKAELDAMLDRVQAKYYYLMPYWDHERGPNVEQTKAAVYEPWELTEQMHKTWGVR